MLTELGDRAKLTCGGLFDKYVRPSNKIKMKGQMTVLCSIFVN